MMPHSQSETGPDIEWLQGVEINGNRVWGLRGHLQWGLPPPSGKPARGPRGLIRLFYPVLPDGGTTLVNFIAVEPVVNGQKGYSELEHSQLDCLPGKRMWAVDDGRRHRSASGVEILEVELRIEPFHNGARPRLTLRQRSDRPDEIEFTVHAEPESATMSHCILTATMGNKARARCLWLQEGFVHSRDLFPDYRGDAFTDHALFGEERLHRSPDGDLCVAITTDEADPAAVVPYPERPNWTYAGFPVVQSWRKPAGSWSEDLQVAVNGRYAYWKSQHPIPGGISFENFELRERFTGGQRYGFSIRPAVAGTFSPF